jgi:hypothetical protein
MRSVPLNGLSEIQIDHSAPRWPSTRSEDEGISNDAGTKVGPVSRPY